MAELVVTTSLDRSGFDKGVAEITTAIAQISAKPIKVKIDGDFSKITADVAKIAVAQEKTKQAIEATKQAQISANAAMAASAAKVAVAQEQVNLAHEKGAQAAATAAGKVAVQQEKTATEAEKTAGKVAQANARIAASQGRVSAEEQKTQQQIEKTAQQHERTAQAAIRAGAQHEAAARRAATATDQLANSVNRVSEAFSGWVMRNIWMTLRNGLRDALNTMREMDTQLTTIRRVSGMSEEEVGQYQEQAYDISSKYGVKPADYLSNVVAFTRAGYGNLAGELAEVTTRLQVVGQVSQETATQMLLAVDAAYKFDDKAKGLGAVLDGVIAIGDNYATSVEKIAEGIGIIAPIAEQAHVGIDELSAAIGTITADTQRSGTEAARALRYVFLNILQNTSTEVEEGVTLTKEEIEGFQDVLEYFIPDVLALAEAEGKVINPMEALGAIAKGVKEDVIDEAQLFEMLTKVAGKLRASQVLALVNDWDKYSDMVKLFGDSVGETDGKVAVSLSSWDAKANMLSASFTKLFGNVLNSSMVKGGLDFLKAFVDLLNIGDGIPAKVLAIGAAFSTISSVISSFATGGRLATTLSSLASFFSNPAFLAGAGIAAALIGIKAIVDAVIVTQTELDDQAEATAQNYGDQKAKLTEITSELEKHKAIVAELEAKGESRTAAENELLATERELTAELERQARIEEYKTEKAWREAAVKAAKAGGNEPLDFAGIRDGKYAMSSAPGLLYGKGDITGTVLAYMSAKNTYEAAKSAYEAATDPELMAELRDNFSDAEATMNSYKGQVVDYIDKNEGYYKLALDYAAKNNLFTKRILTNDEQSILDFVQYYRNFLSFMGTNLPEFGVFGADGAQAGGTTGKSDKSSQKQSQTDWAAAQQSQLKRTQALIKANKEYNDTLQTGQKFARITQDTYDDLTSAGLDLADAVIKDGKEFVITREALDGFIKSSKEWYENYGLEMPDNFKEIAESAETAAGSFEELLKSAGGMADEVAGASKALADLKAQLKDGGEQGDTLKAYRDEYKAVMEMWEKGFYGSRELRGFFNLMFGEEQMAKWGWDYKKAGEEAGGEFFKAMFSPDGKDDFGKQALSYIYKNLTDSSGNVVDENGKVVASFQNVNGEIKATVNSFDGLAKVVGINKDVLLTLFDALGIYKNGLNTTGNDVTKLLDSMGDGVSKLNNGAREVDLGKFINTLAANGGTVAEIFQLIQSMGGMKGISFGDADIKDTASLYEKIHQAVANANNKDLQLKPDASGWTAYEGTATSAIQGVQERWASSSAEISSTSPQPTVDTSGLDEAGATIDKASGAIEKLGKAEGTGKAYIDVEGVEEGEETVKGAGQTIEEFGKTKGTGGAGMDTEGVPEGEAVVKAAKEEVERYDGTEGKAKAELDTEETAPGKQILEGLIYTLYRWGAIDETAVAAMEADLDDPEARIKIAQALLTAFADTPGTAEAGIDLGDMEGELPSVINAKETLEKYGVNYKAVVHLEDNVPAGDQEKFEGLLFELLALDKTFTANLVLNDDSASTGDKLAKIKELHEYLEKLRSYAGDRSIAYIDVGVDPTTLEAAQATIDEFAKTVKSIHIELQVIVDAAGMDDGFGQDIIEKAQQRLNGLQAKFTATIEQEGAEEVERAAELVTSMVGDIPDHHDTKLEADDEATGVIRQIESALTDLNGQSATVYINAVTNMGGLTGKGDQYGAYAGKMGGAPSGAGIGTVFPNLPKLLNKAEGTRNFPGGRSLVNELGPELIAYGGKAFVAGGGYPTIVNLPKGAMIFDAEETRGIVANSGGLPSGVIGSHAGGAGYYIGSRTGYGGNSIIGAAAAAIAAAATIPDWSGTIEGITGKGKGKGKGGGGGGTPVDNTDYWAIVEAHYKEITAVADNATTNLEYQIKLLKDAWDDEKKPLDEQIKALQDLNGIIDRQITLLTRERDKLTKPIQDEVDALKEAKDIQDDQLELEERQKAVEEARAELQNAQNERTIRFYNKETGHWEWMADQKRVQDAQKALEDAQKSLADFEYDQRIKALEAEIKAIEDEYQDKFDKLNEDKQANEDEIYDLNQQLKDLERKYNELIGPLEEEKEDRARAKEAAENAWTNAQFERREAPKGNLDLAISKTGVPGSIAGGGIKELQADLKTIANAYKGSQQNNTLASLGIQFGATPSYAGTSSVTTVGNNVSDSHDIVINGITLPASAAYQSLMDLANDLSIYVNYK